jgi:N-acyl-D-aspartate/D-glutamate deacylase
VLSDPAFRAAIKAEARGRSGVPNRFSYHSLEHMTIKEVTQPRNAGLVGRNVAELARAQGKDPFDWFLDFGLDGELDAMVDCKLFNTDEDAVRELIRHPHAQVTLSDAGAHLSFLCDAGFGLHLFGHWARERGDLSLEQAVQSVTSRPADLYRMKDRGRLAPGAWADLVLFDPATVGRGPKRRVSDLPGGAIRVDTPATGLHGVWVNGVRAVDERGAIADCGRPGKLMREFGR